MYVCLDCNKIFEEPKHYIEQHGLDTPPYEEGYRCVYCGGAYTEAPICCCCDDYITSDYIITSDGNRYCENCFVNMKVGDEDY